MAQRSGIFLFPPQMYGWLSIPRARFSSAVPCLITARIYKRAASKSQTRTPWLIALAAKASRSRTCFRPTNRAIEPCADADELYLHDLSFLMLEMIIN